jgi:NUMOD1 domain
MECIKLKKLNIKFYNEINLRAPRILRGARVINHPTGTWVPMGRFNNFSKVKPLIVSNDYKLCLRKYSTCHSKSNNTMISEILQEIINELDLAPVYIFENLNLEIIRQQILKDTKGLSGIYMIVNKITRDYYIGSAVTNRLYVKFSNHLIYYRGSRILKSAVKKYRLKNFAFIILELYPNVVTKENNKELIDLEDKYLKSLLPNYNILTEAGSNFGYKHTEMDRWKSSFPPIHHKKIKTNIMRITLYNLTGTIYGKYSTLKDAAKAINCSAKTIRRALKTDKKLVRKQ